MPRAQNAHAHVNAAFLFEFNQNKTLVEKAKIVYGGINSDFIHAGATEKYVIGKNIFSNDTLQHALNILNEEIQPNVCPPEPSPEYRRKLAVGLFYKV
jgi:xanthine dehydrogenase/oxidase